MAEKEFSLFDSVAEVEATEKETVTDTEKEGISLREIAVLARDGGITEKKEKTRAKTEVVIEVAEDSAPDLVLRRKTSRSSTLLVLMPSQNLFCTMDEKTKEMTPLTERSLSNFAQDGELQLPEWAGGNIRNDKYARDAIIAACSNGYFVEMLRWRVVNYATACSGYGRGWGCNSHEVKQLYEVVKDHRPACEYARVTLNPQSCLDRNCIAAVCKMDDALGLDNCRNVFKGIVECLRDSGGDFLLGNQVRDLTERLSEIFAIRENKTSVYLRSHGPGYVQVQKVNHSVCGNLVSFDMAAMNRYLFERSEAEGYADIAEWARLWRDDLYLQVAVTGKVVEKYPENLLTHHQILCYEASKIVEVRNEERWAEVSRECERLDWNNGKYVVVHPNNAADLADEAVQQGNCVRSYETNLLEGKLQIAFLRLASDPTKSWVTLEIRERDGVPTVVQCKGRYNSTLNEEQKKALDAWKREKNVA